MRRCRSTFYRPQRSFAKVMFLQVCVCPRGGVSIPACLAGGIPACLAAGLQGVCYPSMHCRWYPSMLCNRSPGGLFWGGACSQGGVCSRGGWYPSMYWGNPPPPGRDGYCCGRYASHWNAFLFCMLLLSPTTKLRQGNDSICWQKTDGFQDEISMDMKDIRTDFILEPVSFSVNKYYQCFYTRDSVHRGGSLSARPPGQRPPWTETTAPGLRRPPLDKDPPAAVR